MMAVLGLGLGLVACRGGSDDDDASSDSVATEEPAGSDTTPATEAGGEGTTPGTEATGDTTAGTAGSATGDVPVNEAAAAVECPDSEPGLTDTSIKLGGTYPLSGPVAAYASVPKGIDAWFKHLNDTQGGITSADGVTREIEWDFLDDQYSPPKSLENVRLLVEQENVWLVLNPLGTPSNMAIRDYMNGAEVPQLLVATGASAWGREIEDYPWTIGYQPDYESEGIAYAQYALAQNPDAKVGILYANDDFGKDYLAGIREGMGDKADQIVAEVTYETTDATIDSQVSQVQNSGADVFMLIATPQFAIQGIKRVDALGWEPLKILTSVSASVGAVIQPAGPDIATGWVSSTYIKDSTDPEYADDPAVLEYKEILAEYYSDANPDDGLYLYGMSVGQTFQRLMESLPSVCRESIMAAVKNFEWADPPLLIPGIGIKTGEGDGFPVQQVVTMEWDGSSWVKSDEIIDAASLGE
jgi:branched-chain amino acid transport system substrate-binding protein